MLSVICPVLNGQKYITNNILTFFVNSKLRDKELLIIGMVNKMEIWNPDRLKEVDLENIKIDPAAYDDLADKIIL